MVTNVRGEGTSSSCMPGRKNSLKDDVVTVERLDTKQRIVPTKKARKTSLGQEGGE